MVEKQGQREKISAADQELNIAMQIPSLFHHKWRK